MLNEFAQDWVNRALNEFTSACKAGQFMSTQDWVNRVLNEFTCAQDWVNRVLNEFTSARRTG